MQNVLKSFVVVLVKFTLFLIVKLMYFAIFYTVLKTFYKCFLQNLNIG